MPNHPSSGDFAALVGINRATLSQIENDKRDVSRTMAERLAAALNCDIEDISHAARDIERPAGGPGDASLVMEASSFPPGGWMSVISIPIVGRVSATGCDYSPNEPPDGMVPVPMHVPRGCRLRALVVSGDCMHPTADDGDFLVVQEPDGVKDGDMLVIEAAGQVMVKRVRIRKGKTDYVPDNKCCKAVVADPAEVKVLAKVYRIIRVRKP